MFFIILVICHVRSAVSQSEGRLSEYGGEWVCSGHDIEILTQRSAWLETSLLHFLFFFNYLFPPPMELFESINEPTCLLAFPASGRLRCASAASWCGARQASQCSSCRGGASTPDCNHEREPFTRTCCPGEEWEILKHVFYFLEILHQTKESNGEFISTSTWHSLKHKENFR